MSLAPLLLTRTIKSLRPELEVFANVQIVSVVGLFIAVFLFVREIKREENLGFIMGILGALLSMLYVVLFFSGRAGLGIVCISYGKVTLSLNLKKYVFLLLISIGVGALIDLADLVRNLRLKKSEVVKTA